MAKVALITGTSSGIGLSTAVRLAKSGYRTVATMRDLAKAGALRARAEAEGVRLDVRRLDVCDPGSIDACLREIAGAYGRLDALVNNAGAGLVGSLEQLSMAELERTMDVNFYGVARATKAALPLLREAGAGRVVTVTSVGGVVGQPFNDAYCAAKFAVEGLLESLAPVARRLGVHVSIVEPGPVSTEFIANLGGSLAARQAETSGPYAPLFAAYVAQVMQSFGAAQTPDEIAGVVLEALTDEAPKLRYVTSDAMRAFVGVKYGDPTGEAVRTMTGGWLEATLECRAQRPFGSHFQAGARGVLGALIRAAGAGRVGASPSGRGVKAGPAPAPCRRCHAARCRR
ncbi:MAG TPA: SDR family oxidoreductase [Polyangiaceae bacterium]|nr:SDR family oxidoreductase [Polyangiaceae bacterium]